MKGKPTSGERCAKRKSRAAVAAKADHQCRAPIAVSVIPDGEEPLTIETAAAFALSIQPVDTANNLIETMNQIERDEMPKVRFTYLLLALSGEQLVGLLRDLGDDAIATIERATEVRKMMQCFVQDFRRVEARLIAAASYMECNRAGGTTGAAALAGAAAHIDQAAVDA